MKWKRILGILVVLIVAVVATVYIAISTYDFNKLKPQVIRAVREATGRELVMKGGVGLDLDLTPSVFFEDVSFQNASWGSRSEMASLKRFEIELSLIPLLRRTIDVKRVVLVEPYILIEVNEKGTSNLNFKTAAPAKKKAPAQADGGKPVLLALGMMNVERGTVKYNDMKKGRSFTLDLDKFSASTKDDGSILDIALKGRYEGKPVEIKGAVKPLNALLAPKGNVELKVEGRGGDALVFIEGSVENPQKMKNAMINIEARGESTAAATALAGVKYPDVPDPGPFSLTAGIAYGAEKLSLKEAHLQVGSKELAQISIKGNIDDVLNQSGISLDFEAKGASFANIRKFIKATIPLDGPFNISGRLESPAAKTYRIKNLKCVIGENDIEGTVEAVLSGKRPLIKGKVLSKNIDVRPFLPQKEKKQNKPASTAPSKVKGKVFSNKPLPLEPLKRFDADVSLRAGKLTLPDTTLTNLSADLFLNNGRLTVRELRFSIAEGLLEATMDVKPFGEKTNLKLKGKLDKVNVFSVLEGLGIKTVIEGPVDSEIDLTARGESLASIMGGLNGKIFFVMGSGRINKDYIGILGKEITTTLLNLINPFKKKTDLTKINCLVFGFDIKEGMAKSNALVIDSDQATVVGGGSINLKEEKLNISLRPAPKEGIGIKGIGKIGISLSELTKPFKIGGTLAKPSIAIDTTQTAITVGKAVGGVMLFGPAGIAAALAGGHIGGKNPCLSAVEAAQKGFRPQAEEKTGK